MLSSKFILSFALFFTLFFCLSQTKKNVSQKKYLLEKYKKADRLYIEGAEIVDRKDYTEEKEEQLNKDALEQFKSLAEELKTKDPGFDSLSFYIEFKAGVLEHYFDHQELAKKHYLKSIELKSKLDNLPDSLLFKPYLYFGIILYNENYFDSSLSIFKKAEQIAQSYHESLSEIERLYNTLGALYYETGNYRQAKNYIEKSLQVIPRSNPYYKELVINYKINLASILTKLEDFDEANSIYQEILPLNINKDIILHNTGVINLKLGAIEKALAFFRKVDYEDNRRQRLFNDFAVAYLNLNQYDSANLYVQKALDYNATSRKTVTKGQTFQTWANLLISENKIEEALQKFQLAIINFYPNYSDTSVFHNPEQYTGVFSYINLFNTLTAKGDAFEELYKIKGGIRNLQAALNAYTSAFKLAEYVERSYDSDEARLFLNKIKYGVHSKPIDISLTLYEATKDDQYLEKTWQFDQMNKASILAYNVSENENRSSDLHSDKLKKEKAVKSAITRLSLKAGNETDPEKLLSINNAIRDNEIELGKIQDSILANMSTKSRMAIPAFFSLQKKILDKNTAIISYHLSEKELLIICFTRKNFIYKRVPTEQFFFSAIDSFIRSLHTISDIDRFNASPMAKRLYNWLIEPVFSSIVNTDRLIIIPDDELNYLPFEALQNAAGNYLTQKFAIQYQYSAALLEKRSRKLANNDILSMAPFADTSTKEFGELEYSRKEIEDLKGKQLYNTEATKKLFIKNANQFQVIHLATHAQVNDNVPAQSFIAFSKSKNDSSENRLFEQEIYNLSLDSTRLIILSACETGSGQLVHGEGMMSLSRAFAYAGCPNIVTSLWKAEDRTTAFLMKRFHIHLSQNKTTDQALQSAKLDLLNSTEIEERYKSPNYWAHIIFIGEYETVSSSLFKWWQIIPILFIIFLWIINYKRKKS